MKAIERLEALLDEKDTEIEQLTRERDNLQSEMDLDIEWQRHRKWDNDPRPSLPVPRLEIEAVAFGAEGNEWSEMQWEYRLIYRHTCDHLVVVPLGLTRRQGGYGLRPRPIEDDLPIRDGVHIRDDATHLCLPAFVVIESEVAPLEPLEQSTRTNK